VKHFDMVKIVKNLRDLKHVVIHHLGRQADGRDKEVYLQQVAQNPKRVIQEEYNDTEAQIIQIDNTGAVHPTFGIWDDNYATNKR
jgi:hypothetical protein